MAISTRASSRAGSLTVAANTSMPTVPALRANSLMAILTMDTFGCQTALSTKASSRHAYRSVLPPPPPPLADASSRAFHATPSQQRQQQQEGKRHGRGKHTRANGTVYEGEYVNGEMSGQGRYTYPNGDVYEGQFERGVLNGQGRYSFASGDSPIVGLFRDGKPVDQTGLSSA